MPLTPQNWWTAWNLEWSAVLPLVVSAWLFGGSRATRRQRLAFLGGWIALFIALISPLDAMGGALFSAHMAQHEILMVIAAPLFVLSVPLRWGVPRGWRRRAARWLDMAGHPMIAWTLHAVVLWVWHAPAFFNAALRNEGVHIAQHFTFFVTALVFWWSVLVRERGAGVLYLFTTAIHTGFLGALFALAPSAWYTPYARTAPAWGLTSLEDQQIGGLIMWVPAGIAYLIAALWLVAQALRRAEARAGAVALLLLVAVALPGCDRDRRVLRQQAIVMTGGGDPDRGRNVIGYYGCGSCHTIYGVPRAAGLVGPPLSDIARRTYIAGVMQNTPDNMMRWIQNPKAVDEKTAMPVLGVNAKDARDIVGYLYSIR